MGAGGRIRRIKAVGGREGEEGWIEGGKGGNCWHFKTFALSNSSGSRYHISISTLLLNS